LLLDHSAESHYQPGITLRHLYRRHTVFSKYLSDFVPSLSVASFSRLVFMVIVQMFGGLLVSTTVTWFAFSNGVYPWISWEDTHSNFGRIIQITTLDRTPTERRVFPMLWLAVPIAGFVFSACFAFTEDVRNEYRPVLTWIRRSILRQSIGKLTLNRSMNSTRSGTLLDRNA
jgi:pheromone a factor receptor